MNRRDVNYYQEWAYRRGRHAAIISLAYSGPEYDILACADYIGEVTLINATTLQPFVKLDRSHRQLPLYISSKLCFLKREDTGECLLAQTGSSESLVGSIALWNVSQSQREGKFNHALLVCVDKLINVFD